MNKGFIAEKAGQFVRSSLEKAIKDSPNPDALTSLLFSCRNYDHYISSASIQLGFPKETIKNMVFDELLPLGIIKLSGEGDAQEFRFIDEVSELIIPPLGFGPYTLINKKGLNQEQIVKAMDSIYNLVHFTYYKRFEFPIDKLRELREKSHKALENLKTDEKMFFHTTLEVPKEYHGFPSFVRENNPISEGRYTQNRFQLRGKFTSPKRAFEAGFDNITGSVILKNKFLIDNTKVNWSPGGIEISEKNNSLELSLENTRYAAAMRGSFNYQQAVREALSIVQDKLEEVLG